MNNLFPGLRHFSETIFPQQQQLFESLSQGQKPHTMMITCTDSRIDPNLVTQTKPGEIFIVRNVGNIVPPYGASTGGDEAAVEFAVEGLGVSNIIICGHTQCGAMAALANQLNLDSLPAVKRWIKHATATRKRIDLKGQKSGLLQAAEQNVLVQAAHLRTHPSVSAALSAGRVQIFGWVYNFESGSILVYDAMLKTFIPSTEIHDEQELDNSRFAL